MLLLKCLRGVPMPHGNNRLNVVLLQSIDYPLVVLDALLVLNTRRVFPGLLIENACPGDRHAIVRDSQLLQKGHRLLFVVLVVESGNFPSMMLADAVELWLCELIPNRRLAAILIRKALDLECSCRCAPDEVLLLALGIHSKSSAARQQKSKDKAAHRNGLLTNW